MKSRVLKSQEALNEAIRKALCDPGMPAANRGASHQNHGSLGCWQACWDQMTCVSIIHRAKERHWYINQGKKQQRGGKLDVLPTPCDLNIANKKHVRHPLMEKAVSPLIPPAHLWHTRAKQSQGSCQGGVLCAKEETCTLRQALTLAVASCTPQTSTLLRNSTQTC